MAKMFYSLDEAAARLDKSADEVRAMIESGELQEFRSGDELVVKREQIDLLVGDDGSDDSVASEILGSGESSMMSQMNDESLGVIGLSDSVVDDDAPIVGVDPDDSLVIGLEDSATEPMPTDDSVSGGSIGLSESVADNINLDGGTNVGSSTGEPLTGDGSGIISLASESGSHAAIELDVPESIDNKDQTGISIFDDSLEDGDDAAATIVTDATEADMTTPDFDAGASGSGLLDLTREGDDTSLGVDLLDDGAGASGAGIAGVGEISDEGRAVRDARRRGHRHRADRTHGGLPGSVRRRRLGAGWRAGARRCALDAVHGCDHRALASGWLRSAAFRAVRGNPVVRSGCRDRGAHAAGDHHRLGARSQGVTLQPSSPLAVF